MKEMMIEHVELSRKDAMEFEGVHEIRKGSEERLIPSKATHITHLIL